MRIIEKEETKVIKTKAYISVDGKEFNTEEDCKKWELSYIGTIYESFKNLKQKRVNGLDLHLPWVGEDDKVIMLKPETLNDLVVINAYIATIRTDYVLNSDYLGKEIAINFGYDNDWCNAYILEDYVKRVQDDIAKIIEDFNL